MKASKNQTQEVQWLLKEKYNGEATADFKKDFSRLKSGEPIDYIIGFTPFLGCKIDLSLKPLIPRTETEFWVERAVKNIDEQKNGAPIDILDVFSGSGCIGIAILTHLSTSTLHFGEKNTNLLLQIKKNLEENNIKSDRYKIFETDCMNSIPEKKYDYIFANPPYISKEYTEDIQASVEQHEPHEALFAPDKGMFFIKKLISECYEFLKPGGTLYIEFNSFQKNELGSYIPKDKYNFSFWKDQFENWRVITLTKKEPQ